MIRKRVIVSGEVQGVFFRDTCRRVAGQQGVAGWVRNLPDGRVEAVFEGEPGSVERRGGWGRGGPAGGWGRNLPDGRGEAVFEGEPESVERLVRWARRGPSEAWVTAMDVHDEPVE